MLILQAIQAFFLVEYIIYIIYILYIYIFINKCPHIYFSDTLRSKICLFQNISHYKNNNLAISSRVSKRKKIKLTYRSLFTLRKNYIILKISKSILFDTYNFINF